MNNTAQIVYRCNNFPEGINNYIGFMGCVAITLGVIVIAILSYKLLKEDL